MYYDIQYSMRRVPVVNTENHIIGDRETRLIPPRHTDSALWQGAIHGQGATTIWVWQRTYDRTHDFEGSILHRPENVLAVGRCGLDLMRLAPEVVKLQRAEAPVAILYGITSLIWSDRAHDAMKRAYEAMSFTGLPVAFVSERQAQQGGLKRYRAVILPSVRHAPDGLCRAVVEYAGGGGKLWILDDDPLARDQYAKPRKVDWSAGAARTWPRNVDPRGLRDAFLAELASLDIPRPVVLRDEAGREPWAVEYRAVSDGQGHLLSVVNHWGQPKNVRISIANRAAAKVIDLRAGRTLSDGTLTLEPLRSMLFHVE